MTIHITVYAICLRVGLAFIASGFIGFDRDERGHSAGMRTNILVCLAACIAMIQATVLTGTVGKAPDSFVVMDTMRFPLGILSGIGFIGAGAILKRGEMIFGVTTAATLWFVTVMGLCFGGGQISLGLGALLLGLVVLNLLKKLEERLPRYLRARLFITLALENSLEAKLHEALHASGLESSPISTTHDRERQISHVQLSVRWKDSKLPGGLESVINRLEAYPGVMKLAARRRQ